MNAGGGNRPPCDASRNSHNFYDPSQILGRKHTAKRRPTTVVIVSFMNSAMPVSARPVKLRDTPETITRTFGTPSELAKPGLARGGAAWRRARYRQQTNGRQRCRPAVFAEHQV